MIYQRRSIHDMADRSIRLMPIAAERPTAYDRHPVLFWVCAFASIIIAAWVTL